MSDYITPFLFIKSMFKKWKVVSLFLMIWSHNLMEHLETISISFTNSNFANRNGYILHRTVTDIFRNFTNTNEIG